MMPLSAASGGHALELELGRDRDPVPQHRRRQRLHVVGHHVTPAVEQRRSLRHLEQRDAAARRGAEGEHRRAPRGADDRRDVRTRLGSTRTRRTPSRRPARTRASATSRDAVAGRQVGLEAAEHPVQDPLLDSLVGITHQHLDHEAVELRLGQRVGALELDRVLRREDGEALGQRVRRAVHGHAALLHRLEQRRLGLGRRAVDLVAQHQVGEDRARAGR